ncbi:MAG: acetolactate decarboxylase [Proteobacteria bacterium]|nr:acetolactate decarboxylase [Pseudomonadota bacterium]
MSGNQYLSRLELHLSDELLIKLKNATERTGCSEAELVDRALRRFFNDKQAGISVYLSAPINALVEGFYVENTTIADIKRHGDFGLGTFNYLDGEMVLLDGIVYQIRSDGYVYNIGDNEQSPFACVTFFNPDTFDDISGSIDSTDFYSFLNNLIPSENMLYAIRIDGIFNHVRTRAVPKSQNYRPLVEATKNQPVFDFHDVEGSLAGFYTPRFMESLNAPGYHMHFLTEDRRHGGHLIECSLKKARIGIQHVPKLEVGLPITLDYLTADLTRDIGKDLDKAER